MPMKRRWWVWCWLLLTTSTVSAQQRFRIMQYNVENLFDCEHDSLKEDKEFLPSAIRGWNSFRFYKKVTNIAKVILAATDENVPDLVGLCEIENERCAEALIHHSPLRELKYRYVMTDSPDKRGIDVALLYQPETFRLLSARSIRMPAMAGRKATRDVLHVMGRVVSRDTLDVFVLHAPSRAGGAKATEDYRVAVAQRVRQEADSIMKIRRVPHVIVMGDFNDYSDNKSIATVWNASRSSSSPYEERGFYDLFSDKSGGTYKYKGEWGMIDHVLVNGRLLCPTSSVRTAFHKAAVFAPSYLLVADDKYGGEQPFKTYHGMKYQGGFSDHLPLIVDLLIDIPSF